MLIFLIKNGRMLTYGGNNAGLPLLRLQRHSEANDALHRLAEIDLGRNFSHYLRIAR
jgi:hypothetical protein